MGQLPILSFSELHGYVDARMLDVTNDVCGTAELEKGLHYAHSAD